MSFNFNVYFQNFFNDEDNIKLLREIMCAPILDEITTLRKTCEEKDAVIDFLISNEVAELKTAIDTLEASNDELEQYQRRNSLRISGITETVNEDCIEIALDVVNETLKLDLSLTASNIDRAHRTGQHKLNKRMETTPREICNIPPTEEGL
ncbi:hypothetical protein CAPTEDRAFT_199644 [Capitella teleta]|uniref:Uncharacterized protein n=1 Tax=Capitella teleta TaxID=283909 RepID=R7U954_CAPTE|nr:hypothetical protein CAPTEDRAFT_199644 [Capitella teleta]|eukprot:ELU02671.1 hypothetical protein CAPTEDRAFT_199644 [Capitella teleta]